MSPKTQEQHPDGTQSPDPCSLQSWRRAAHARGGGSSPAPRVPAASTDARPRPPPAHASSSPPPRSLLAHEVTQGGGTAPDPVIATTPVTEVCWPWAT
ncbi:hypothetical protein AV530_019978 [Patagioenas fasciata monilis]|uniref:Uncharacterized protein n=1 Tax=Patagioenas fasciata monilis TaxID=372326 RepID=A0A1V4JHK2_PATFA|nr:hypothetical protein AV530_019978 [Patagioenas fasciata monilis]